MKPYGLPRIHGVTWPDVADIKEFGRPGRVGHLRGPGGEFRSWFRNAGAKARTRRIFKRRARTEGQHACQEHE